MKEPNSQSPFSCRLLIGIIALLLGVRFVGLNWAGFWADELWSVWRINIYIKPFYHSVYFFGLKLWSSIFGNSEEGLRSFSVVISLLNLAMTYLAASTIFDKKTGLVAVIAQALFPLDVYLGRQIREYPLLMLLSTISFWAFYRYTLNRQLRWLGFTICTLGVAMLTHVFAAYTFAAIAVLLLLSVPPEKRWRAVAGVAVGGVLISITAATMFSVIVTPERMLLFLEHPALIFYVFTPSCWKNGYILVLEMLSGPVRPAHILDYSFIPLANHAAVLTAIVGLIYSAARGLISKDDRSRVMYISVWIIVPMIAASYIEGALGLVSVNPRYIAMVIPGLAILFAYSIMHVLSRRLTVLVFTPILLIAIISITGYYKLQYDGGVVRYRQLVESVSKRAGGDDLVFAGFDILGYYEKRFMPNNPVITYWERTMPGDVSRFVYSPAKQVLGLEGLHPKKAYYVSYFRDHNADIWIAPDHMLADARGKEIREALEESGFRKIEVVTVTNWTAWHGPPTVSSIRFSRAPQQSE